MTCALVCKHICHIESMAFLKFHIKKKYIYQYLTKAVTCKGLGWSGYVRRHALYMASNPGGVTGIEDCEKLEEYTLSRSCRSSMLSFGCPTQSQLLWPLIGLNKYVIFQSSIIGHIFPLKLDLYPSFSKENKGRSLLFRSSTFPNLINWSS